MGKFNLTDAAKAIMEGSKETFDANIRQKMSQRGQTGTKPEEGKDKLSGDVAYGTKEVGSINANVTMGTKDGAPQATKGTPQATPPGATPPVGSEKDGVGATKPSGQPQETMGRSDLLDIKKTDAVVHSDEHRDRKPSKLAPQMMDKNPGATFQQYEETDADGNVIEEEEYTSERRQALEEKMKIKMKEDIDALLDGENLSEEFVSKATTIFEAAVIARSEEVIAEAQQELVEQFEVAVEQIKEDLASKVDDYLNYMVEEWMRENEVAIERGLRAEIAESFMSGLRELFVEHYIDVPEEKVDIVEELTTKVEELEGSLNEQIGRGIELSKALNEQKKIEAIYTACEGLTQTQVEKLKSLAESVEFTTEDEFAGKLGILKESYFKADVKVADSSALDEVLVEEDKKTGYVDPSMELYAKTISQTLVK